MKSRILKTGNIVALTATLALTGKAWSMGSAHDTSLTPRTMVRAKGVYSAHHWTRFDSLLKKNAARFGISDWRWLKAVAINESNLGLAASVANGMANPRDAARNRSYDGRSWGVMQTALATANDMRSGSSAEDLNDPAISIYIGAKYLAQLLSRYGGNLEKAVMAYNQGPGNTDRGKTYAGRYWKKFQSSVVLIESKGGQGGRSEMGHVSAPQDTLWRWLVTTGACPWVSKSELSSSTGVLKHAQLTSSWRTL